MNQLNQLPLLQFFRINDPYRLFGLLLVSIICMLPLFIDSPGLTSLELKSLLVGEKVKEGFILYTELVDNTAPLAGWADGFLSLLFGRSLVVRQVIGFLIVFLQATYIGMLFINKKAFAENTYIPSVIFIGIAFFSFDNFSLTPELIGSGFLLLALNRLFKELEFREQPDESIFNLGLFLSLATLFSLTFTLHFIGAIVILTAFTRNTLRKYLLMVVGFLLPHALLMSSYFIFDGFGALWYSYYVPGFTWWPTFLVSLQSLSVLGAVPLFFLLIAFIMLNREARLSKYQGQLVQSMFIWLFFSLLQGFLSKEIRAQSFITIIPSLSFFIAHYLLLIRRRRLAEISLWILMTGTLTVSYLARYHVLESVSYKSLLVETSPSFSTNKRILVLDDDLTPYRENKLASPFLNWRLSKSFFIEPDYYEHVILVHEGLTADPPEIIRDADNLLAPFLDRMPALQKRYKKEGIYYYQIVNN